MKKNDAVGKCCFAPSDKMLAYETEQWNRNIKYVAGVDEAGRGPLAGPLVVAAVMFRANSEIPCVNDSKKLTLKHRKELRKLILNTEGVKYSLQIIPVEVIDEINILQATHLGMRNAVKELGESVEIAFIDGLPVPNFPVKSQAVVKGDAKVATIAAASILAKTTRDDIMLEYSELYPQYGFEKNNGYGTAQHLAALKKFGVTPIHRRSFAPVDRILHPSPIQNEFDF